MKGFEEKPEKLLKHHIVCGELRAALRQSGRCVLVVVLGRAGECKLTTVCVGPTYVASLQDFRV